MDVRASLNAEDNQVYVTGEGAQSNIENDSFFAKKSPLAASTVGRSKSRRQYLEEDTEAGSFLGILPKNQLPRAVFADPGKGYQPDGVDIRTSASDVAAGYDIFSGDGHLADFGAGNAGDEWSVVNAWCRENINKNDFDTDGKSSLGIINVEDMDLSSNHLLMETPMEELQRYRGGPQNMDKIATATKSSTTIDSSGSQTAEGSSTINHSSKADSNPRLLEGSSSNQDKGLLTVDSHMWQQEGSSSTSHDSKDHPFARSKLSTVKKTTGGSVKPADSLTAAIKQSLFGQIALGEVSEEADTSVHNVELGADDLHELDQDFGEMECSIGEESDKEDDEGAATPTNKGADSKLASLYLRHGLTESCDGADERSKKLTYLSKVALFDENGNDFNSGSELDTEDELEIARKGMRHEAAGEDSATEESTRPGLEGGCSDSGERQLPITQRQSAEGIVVSPVPGDGGGGGDGSSGSESDDGRRSGLPDDYQTNRLTSYAVSVETQYSQNTGNQEQRIRPMGDDLLTEMRHSRYASSSVALDGEDTRLQSRYLRPISPGDDLTGDNFNVEDFLTSPDRSEQQDFDPGNRLEASGFNANDVKESSSNPFGAMVSSFGSFGLGGSHPGDDSLTYDLGMPFNTEFRGGTQSRLSGGENVNNETWERLIGSNRTSATSRSGSFGAQQISPRQGPSPARSQENIPSMPGRSSRENSLGERTAASGSLGRSSGGAVPLARSASPVSGYSSEGSDPGITMPHTDRKADIDGTLFKVPTMPAPKSGFKTMTTKAKTTANQRKEPSERGSGQSSTRSSAQLGYDDLAIRISLTEKAVQQKEGLKRVPSIGGTSELDLTVPDSEFFGNDEALLILDSDEKQFEEDNVFRQDDAMVDTGSPNDSWAYQSIQSIARPSWMEPGDEEETLHVRISVGTFIRGRTAALGTLEGDGSEPRPDFGMHIQSPPKVSARPVGLVDIEESRTSGVGENSNGEHDRTANVGISDETLTVEALSADNTAQESIIDFAALGISNIDKTLKHDTSGLNMDDISMFFKSNKDPTKIVEELNKLRDSKHQSTASVKPNLASASQISVSNPQHTSVNKSSSPTISSHLPIRKGSNISRNFPRVGESDQTFDAKRNSNISNTDSFLRGTSLSDASKGAIPKTGLDSNKGNLTSIKSNTKDASEDRLITDVWTSPPRASLCPETSGVLEKLQEFSFKFSTSKMDAEKNKVASDLRERFNEESVSEKRNLINSVRTEITEKQQSETYVGERETPPPDGQANSGSNGSQNMQPSVSVIDGLNGKSDLGTRSKRYDSGFDSVSTSQFRDSSISRQRDLLNAELKSAIRSRSFMSTGSELSGVDLRDAESSRSSATHSQAKSCLSTTGSSHVGFVPGHHVPDGTEYSHQSDYSHMDHKGMSRDDLEGTADIGLADSRGFDAIRGTKSQISAHEMERMLRSQIQYERDKELRMETHLPSEISVGDRTAQTGSQNNKSKSSVNLQPSQSLSPSAKSRSSINKNTGFGDQGVDMNDEHKTVETQTAADRHESWTQTSVVLRESIGLQPDENLEAHFQNMGNSLVQGNNVSSTAQGNAAGRINSTSVKDPEKPNLLSNDSLLNTEFAQEYLKRDFSREVMDRIYSSDQSKQAQHFSETSMHPLNGRESIESRNNWTMLRPNETMETTYDDRGHNNLADLTRPSFYHRPPTACSTPFPGIKDMQTTLTPSSMHTLPSTGYQSMVMSDRNQGKVDRGPLCPVRAPGVLKFSEACVVGISKTETLPLTNPTDRWLECILKVKSVEIDGKRAKLDSFPFEMRQKKIILDPHKTENLEVLFLPSRPGAFVAEVLVFSQLFLRNEKDSVDGIPVSVTFQAIAEKPKITVNCEDEEGGGVISFGELSWGMCKEKTVCLKNQGLATVPLRLAIVSEGTWHCFSFEPEGRASDVSIISGQHLPRQTRSVINLCLPGANTPFNYHEIKVWCRPPDKHCDRAMARLPSEHFRCKIEIELDTPYSKVSMCRPLRFEAVVGVHKLHIQSNIKELQLSACPGKSRETEFKIYNAGNLELNLSFWFMSHADVFFVTPDTILGLQPAEEAMLKIKFAPEYEAEQRFNSLLILMVQPQGPMFEVQVQGDVLPLQRDLGVLCDCTEMDFGGVVLGQTCLKRFRLINRESVDITMTLRARVDEVELYRSSDTSRRGVSVLDLLLKPDEIVPVYVLFAPSMIKPVRGKIVMKSEQSNRKYTVHVSGYGGVSKLCCSERSTESVSMKGFSCIGVRNLTTERVKHFYINNRGSRAASVKVSAFADLSCKKTLPAGQVIVQPNDFVIDSQGTQKVEIVISMSEKEFAEHCRRQDVGAALSFSYQDKIDWRKPHKSQLVVGLIETGKKVDSRAGGSHSMTCGSQNITAQSDHSSKLSQTAPHMAVRSEKTVLFSSDGPMSDWILTPEELVLYCPTGDREPEIDMFHICNRKDEDISFQLSWPADMITLKPGRGTIKSKDRQRISIAACQELKQCLDQLPWSGSVTVHCGKDVKTLKVEVRRETVLPVDRPPVKDEQQSLVPVGTSHPSQNLTEATKLGNLEISRTTVQFSATRVGKTSEEVLELKNSGKDTIRWMFSSFAAPYLRKKADSSKELFRVSHKVFDFSHQFGKLNGYSTLQLKLQFMPRSVGTFSQYWDIQTTGNSSNTSQREDCLRVHLTGEGVEEEPKVAGPTVAVADLMPRSRSEQQKLKLTPDLLKFPCMCTGSSTILKVDLKNGYLDDVMIEVTEPRPPFYIRHRSIKIDKKRYLRFPVEFEPSRAGSFTDTVKFQSSKGETLVLRVEGQCK